MHWWKAYDIREAEWTTIFKNCSTTVGRGLMAGGGDDYARGLKGWYRSWNTFWTPNNVLQYATAIHHGLKVKAHKHFAINLIRRFCVSRLAITSLTWEMDEEGLAKALYNAVGIPTNRVREVFKELDENRNSDADDVAEAYVNLLLTNKGPQLQAVKADHTLKHLLIKVMREGLTSFGEQKCISFLKSL